MTVREAVHAWVQRVAEAEGVKAHHFTVEPDGFVYAMPEWRVSSGFR